jgi:AsmA protein
MVWPCQQFNCPPSLAVNQVAVIMYGGATEERYLAMIKTFLKIISVFLVLLVVAVAGFVATFDANDYKEEIVTLAEALTGREISITGDVDVSVEYPCLAIKVNKIAIDNPPGFGKKTFATIDEFDVSLKIVPLLINRLDLDRLVLHHLKADLVKKASGENNWTGIVDEPTFGFVGLNIGSIELKESNLSWSDVGTGKQYKFLKMSVVSQAVKSDQPLPVEIKAFVISKQPQWQAGVNLKSRLMFNENATEFDANDLKLVIKALLPDTSNGKVSFVMAADSTIDLESGSVKLNNTRIAALGLDMSGTFAIENMFTGPVVQGLLKVDAFDAAVLAKNLKVDMPRFANESSLSRISLTTSFKTDFDSVYLDNIVASVDESELTGFFHITDMEKLIARYELTVNKLRLNDYTLAGNNPADNEASFALKLISGADMEGTLDVGSVVLDDAELSNFHVVSVIKNDIFNAEPITMLVGANELDAKMKLDVQDASAIMFVAKVNNADANVIINPVLKTIVGDEVPTLSGAADFDVNLKASGVNWEALKRSTKGTIKLDMQKIVVEGFDFDRAARKVVNDYSYRYDFRASKTFMSTFLADSITEFDGLHATLNLSQGKMVNNDLKLVSDKVTVTGSGYIDFINDSVDYRPVIDMNVESTANLRDKLRDHPMEYDVRGAFGDLAYNFDAGRYDLLVGRMLIQEAKARQYRQINQQKNTSSDDSWTNAISTK